MEKGYKDKARGDKREGSEQREDLPGFLTNVGVYEAGEWVNSRLPGGGAEE